MTGLFITFEGGEGSGKTTQIAKVQHAFAQLGKRCIMTREPGGSPQGETIRQLVLTGAAEKWTPIAETLLFQASRVEHVERIIKPALNRGDIVLCDRFLDSTLVYQGIAKNLGVEMIQELHRLTLQNLQPDLTLLLDIDPAIGLERAGKRSGNETRFESLGLGFHHLIRNGFLQLAKAEPERFAIIDAAKSEKEVQTAIWQAVSRLKA